jgi:bifunctional non-homologous end joining protein LigD
LLRLPEPVLARAGAIPTDPGWRFEPKLDGFRCLVCTHGRFHARSRRGWNMSPLLPELADALPQDVQLDGELVALDAGGNPDFQRLCKRMLHRHPGIAVTYMVFDVLAFDGEPTTSEPYRERRRLLEALKLGAPHAGLLPTFTNGERLFAAVVEHGLEGVVAKREHDGYRPGERLWVKTKNRATARFAEEIAERRGATQTKSSETRESALHYQAAD